MLATVRNGLMPTMLIASRRWRAAADQSARTRDEHLQGKLATDRSATTAHSRSPAQVRRLAGAQPHRRRLIGTTWLNRQNLPVTVLSGFWALADYPAQPHPRKSRGQARGGDRQRYVGSEYRRRPARRRSTLSRSEEPPVEMTNGYLLHPAR